MNAFSFGGGVQSTAALVLAAERKIDYQLFLFANVGADSENPATLAYLEEVARPYAARHGLELVELRKHRRGGETDTIRQWLDRTPKSIGIPVRMANGAPGNRSCTQTFKIEVINKELRRRGASTAAPATLGMGITLDEWQRMRTDREPFKHLAYPLIEAGLHRHDCIRLIEDAGLPVPPKSSCWFCPFTRTQDWQRMKRDAPALFAQAVALEGQLNARRAALGRDPVFLSSRVIPLAQVAGTHDQLDMFEPGCDIAGYCHV